MNKDETTEKAQELTIKNVTDGKNKYYSWGYYNGCIVGLEYNKKRIADLEQKVEIERSSRIALVNKIAELEKENAELKEQLLEQKQYTAFKCNEAVKKKEVYEMEHYLLTTAKEIIKKLKALYFSPVVTKDDVKRQDEILAEVEQFLNEVEK